jgi:hypothetical protein
MVQSRLRTTIDHAFERTIARAGTARFAEWVRDFFAEKGPRSPYLRDIPGEFLEFLAERPAPPLLLDMARYEWTELAVAYLPDEQPEDAIVELAMHLPAVLTRAHRVLRLQYPVHRSASSRELDDHEDLEPEPVCLCLYRDPRSYEVRTLELTQVTASLLEAIAPPDSAGPAPSLTDAIRRSVEQVGAVLDEPFVLALSDLLTDFLERGLLRGSRAPG